MLLPGGMNVLCTACQLVTSSDALRTQLQAARGHMLYAKWSADHGRSVAMVSRLCGAGYQQWRGSGCVACYSVSCSSHSVATTTVTAQHACMYRACAQSSTRR